jgi:hypothetical protein
MSRNEDYAVDESRAAEGDLDTTTDGVPQRPEVRIQNERARVIGDDAEVSNRRAFRSDDEIERSGDMISLEEARAQFSEEQFDRLLSHRLLRGESGAQFWLREDVERVLGLD